MAAEQPRIPPGHDPFTSPTPKGYPPYHLRGEDPVAEAKHCELLRVREALSREQRYYDEARRLPTPKP